LVLAWWMLEAFRFRKNLELNQAPMTSYSVQLIAVMGVYDMESSLMWERKYSYIYFLPRVALGQPHCFKQTLNNYCQTS